jgi:hypothetical protein
LRSGNEGDQLACVYALDREIVLKVPRIAGLALGVPLPGRLIGIAEFLALGAYEAVSNGTDALFYDLVISELHPPMIKSGDMGRELAADRYLVVAGIELAFDELEEAHFLCCRCDGRKVHQCGVILDCR